MTKLTPKTRYLESSLGTFNKELYKKMEDLYQRNRCQTIELDGKYLYIIRNGRAVTPEKFASYILKDNKEIISEFMFYEDQKRIPIYVRKNFIRTKKVLEILLKDNFEEAILADLDN